VSLPGGMRLIVMSGVYIPRVPSILLAVVVSILLFVLFLILFVLSALLAVLAPVTFAPEVLPTLQHRPSHLLWHLDAVGPVLYMGKVFTLPAVP